LVLLRAADSTKIRVTAATLYETSMNLNCWSSAVWAH
jgi:hypothetical protein